LYLAGVPRAPGADRQCGSLDNESSQLLQPERMPYGTDRGCE